MDVSEVDLTFSQYCQPLGHLMFSTEFFGKFTVSQLLELSYPTMAPVTSVLCSEFSDDIPSSAAATLIQPNEVLPCYSDLNFVTAKLDQEYELGMRSVIITFTYLEQTFARSYHFSKLSLIRNVANWIGITQAYRHLLNHLQSPQFSLGDVFSTLNRAPAAGNIQGFLVSQFPLYKLESLLGENWLEEDVFNVLLELTYFRRTLAATSGSSTLVCDVLVLPTTFFGNAQRAYLTKPRIYTPEIISIRNRITQGTIHTVAIALNSGDHYTAFVYRPGSSAIEYGDSLHGSPPSESKNILQWIFNGISSTPITHIVFGTIGRQGLGNGEGSCGIACHNFIELSTKARHGLQPWTGADAGVYRDAALEDLVRLHHLASLSCTPDTSGAPSHLLHVIIPRCNFNVVSAAVRHQQTSQNRVLLFGQYFSH